MELLGACEPELPPLQLGMLLDCEPSSDDDWLDGISFTPCMLSGVTPHPIPQPHPHPSPCVATSAPVPISSRRPTSALPCGPQTLTTAHYTAVEDSSWESTRSLLASTLMDDVSAPASLAPSGSHAAGMVPLEQLAPASTSSFYAPAAQLGQPAWYHDLLPSAAAPLEHLGYGSAIAELQAQQAVQHHGSLPPSFQQQLAIAPGGYTPCLVPQPTAALVHSYVQQQQHMVVGSSFGMGGGEQAWHSGTSAPQLMAVDPSFYPQQGSFPPVAGMVPVQTSNSAGSLTAHSGPVPMQGISGDSMTEGSDHGTHHSHPTLASPPLLSSPVAAAATAAGVWRSPSAKSRVPRAGAASRAGSLKRSAATTGRALAGTIVKVSSHSHLVHFTTLDSSSPSSERPLRSAAKRSLVLTSAAAELVEDQEDDDSDASVDLASADDGGRSSGSPQPTGSTAGATAKKKHNPWSLAETEALVEGVRIVGPGKWAEIKKLPLPALTGLLATRSAVDLKDKWRNLTRVARLPKSALKQRMSKGNSEVPLELILQVKDLMEASQAHS